ncbi:thioredoxin family protein [Flavobacterium sp. DG1-102-2]|uniref:thioredoxin family protein n=1 Tax=Flavobacterium sp. DG1-102-2 TaxID=3081663 RepID=UPI0029498428|nr:thioredoxin family protein [Flavobacterium sp. DG1-102-2]MDV6170004.1 thioredoxin family protein [Flavobacterium sp. DG1-102-2]
MENFKKYIPWTIRIVIAVLFLISAAAKMYPSPYFAISTFEVKQLYPLGFSPEVAVYFSRTLIGIEFALGLLILQPHYLKRFVTPATILMLVVFIIHLTIDTIVHGNSGSCGCFGSLLPMTPVEAIIKNIVAVILLVWLYKLLPAGSDKNNFWILTTVTLAAILGVFMSAPIQPAQHEPATVDAAETIPAGNSEFSTIATEDSTNTTLPAVKIPTTETEPATETKPAADEPAHVKSVYSQYFANADKGKKIIGLFAPGCEHCMDTAKQLTEMKAKNKDFPELEIIFMDEEAEKIPDFFKFAGAQYPYKVIDIITFWKVLGNANDTPGVVYLWNGNKIKEWDGINERKFVASQLMSVYKKSYSQVKK